MRLALAVLLCALAWPSLAQQSPAPLELTETGFKDRFAIRGPVTLRELRAAFSDYRVVRERREAEAGGHYELFCMSRWGRNRDCKIEWVLDGNLVRRIRVFDARVVTPTGLRIGDTYRDRESVLSGCYTETGLIIALVCEIQGIPEGYAYFNLDPMENHEPPLPTQLDAAKLEWMEVAIGTEVDD